MNTEKEKLVLIGAGGYAKSVIDSIDLDRYEIVGFIDEYSKEERHLGYPIYGNTLDDVPHINECLFFISIGNNVSRKKWYDRLNQKKLSMINIVDKSAIVSSKAKIGIGCFIGKMAIVNSKAIVGNNTIINTKALVEHGCVVGNHVNISTNSVINGDVVVGDGTTLYSCTTVIGQTKIGEWTITGAGTVVVDDLPSNVLAVGVPGKIIKRVDKYDEQN